MRQLPFRTSFNLISKNTKRTGRTQNTRGCNSNNFHLILSTFEPQHHFGWCSANFREGDSLLTAYICRVQFHSARADYNPGQQARPSRQFATVAYPTHGPSEPAMGHSGVRKGNFKYLHWCPAAELIAVLPGVGLSFFFVGSCVNDFSVMKIKAMQKCFELSWELVSSCKIIEIYNAG